MTLPRTKAERFCPYCDKPVQYGSVAKHKKSLTHLVNLILADKQYALGKIESKRV